MPPKAATDKKKLKAPKAPSNSLADFPFDSAKWRWHAVPRSAAGIAATKGKNPQTFLLVDMADPPTHYLTTDAGIPCSNTVNAVSIFWSKDLSKLLIPPSITPQLIDAKVDLIQTKKKPAQKRKQPSADSVAAPAAAAASKKKKTSV